MNVWSPLKIAFISQPSCVSLSIINRGATYTRDEFLTFYCVIYHRTFSFLILVVHTHKETFFYLLSFFFFFLTRKDIDVTLENFFFVASLFQIFNYAKYPCRTHNKEIFKENKRNKPPHTHQTYIIYSPATREHKEN